MPRSCSILPKMSLKAQGATEKVFMENSESLEVEDEVRVLYYKAS